jgi:hypothetical protein
MIARFHGARFSAPNRTTIDLYPPISAYRNAEENDSEAIWDWARRLCDWAKLQFPTCTFDFVVKVHVTSKLYVSIAIVSKSSAHEEAADWLEYNSLNE